MNFCISVILLSIKFYVLFDFYVIKGVNCNLISDVLKAEPVEQALGAVTGGGVLDKLSLLNLFDGATETPEGKPIYEGDIVGDAYERKGVRDDGQLWPEGIVPYVFHNSIVEGQRKIILEAMNHWEANTCVRFREKTLTDLHYIRFRSDTEGCWTTVGRKYMKIGVGQDISLGVGCATFYTSVHEIGHSIGFYHEHARSDRDKYVKVLWDNIKEGMRVQFELKDSRNEEVEYDYRSIMHYPAWAFSSDPLVKNSVVSLNPLHQYLIDEERETMSFRDVKLTNILYKCSHSCPNFSAIKCYNSGYLSAYKKDGKNCHCMCPSGFSGPNCKSSLSDDHSYYGPLKCGGNVTTEGVISTPNYPHRKKAYQSCGWWIQAPEGMNVQVVFDDFSFCQPYDGEERPSIRGKCLNERVEIRNSNDIYRGTIYCGEQIKPGTVITSQGRYFIIIIVADNQMKGRGLKAQIKFVKNTNQSPPKVCNNQLPVNRVINNRLFNAEDQQLLSGILG